MVKTNCSCNWRWECGFQTQKKKLFELLSHLKRLPIQKHPGRHDRGTQKRFETNPPRKVLLDLTFPFSSSRVLCSPPSTSTFQQNHVRVSVNLSVSCNVRILAPGALRPKYIPRFLLFRWWPCGTWLVTSVMSQSLKWLHVHLTLLCFNFDWYYCRIHIRGVHG